MTRLTRVLIGALVASAALMWSDAPTASADAPAAAGWWTSLNPGSTLGSPTPPPPPDVPADGLLIEGGPNSTPTAFAALVYELPGRTTAGKLTLAVAPNSATTPATSLQLCPLTNTVIVVEHGGPMSDAPTYTCSSKLTVAPSADGSHYQLDVARLVVDGVLAVAILPTGQTDRVVLAAPDASSLATIQAPVPSGTGTETAVPKSDRGAAPPPFGAGGPPVVGVTGRSGAVASSAPALAVSTPQVPAPAAATTAPPFQASSFTPSSTRTKPIAVVLVIASLVVAGALWEGAGRAAARAALDAQP